MKQIIPVVIADNQFLCEIVDGKLVVYPGKKKRPLNEVLNPGAIVLIENQIKHVTGEVYEIKPE